MDNKFVSILSYTVFKIKTIKTSFPEEVNLQQTGMTSQKHIVGFVSMFFL